MDPKDINPTKLLKKIEATDFIYWGIILLFVAITASVFFYSTNFILSNANKIFSLNEKTDIKALDLTRYLLVEKKLNLPINSPEGQANPTAPIVTPTVDSTVTPVTN